MMMDSTDAWTQFFGWCTVLNIGIYLVAVVALLTMRNVVMRHGARLLGLPEEIVWQLVLQRIGTYKVGILLFAFVPWLALKLMA